jgi:2-keto-4-pentenoate hydratase/2-oxohepta-3-ene-1,7-dioic acid hydratase in catechol pathway
VQGLFVGPGTQMGEPVDAAAAADHMFGFVLINDWSGACREADGTAWRRRRQGVRRLRRALNLRAPLTIYPTPASYPDPPAPSAARDIQRWEYVPLGPFGAKNFATTISPWVVTLEALEPFRCATSAGAQTEPVPLPYLRDPAYGSWDVQLEVAIAPTGDAAVAAALPPSGAVVSRSNFKYMYWSPAQQLAHHTVTGCNMRPGDLLGSGTISGPVRGGGRGKGRGWKAAIRF